MELKKRLYAYLFAIIIIASQTMHLFHSHISAESSFQTIPSKKYSSLKKHDDSSLKLAPIMQDEHSSHNCAICYQFFYQTLGESLNCLYFKSKSQFGFKGFEKFYHFCSAIKSDTLLSYILRGPPVFNTNRLI